MSSRCSGTANLPYEPTINHVVVCTDLVILATKVSPTLPSRAFQTRPQFGERRADSIDAFPRLFWHYNILAPWKLLVHAIKRAHQIFELAGLELIDCEDSILVLIECTYC